MAKKTTTEIVSPDGRVEDAVAGLYDAFFAEELKNAQATSGESMVYAGNEYVRRIYGLPIEYLNYQYLFGMNILPMEKMYLFAGPKASHKSCLVFEMARWCARKGGFARLYETENKYNPQLVRDLWGNTMTQWAWRVTDCSTITDWQKALQEDMGSYRKAFHIDVPLNRGETRPPLLPVVYAVDSLTGRGTEDQLEKTVKGDVDVPGYAQAKTAGQIAYHFQQTSLLHMPAYLMVVQHEKEAMDSGGGPFQAKITRTTGGSDPGFRAAFDMRLSPSAGDRRAHYQYNNVAMRLVKNSYGPSRRRIVVPFGWDFAETPEGNVRQRPRWEWAHSECEFLRTFGSGTRTGEPAGLKDIIEIKGKSTSDAPGNLFSCKALGLSEVAAEDLHNAIHQDAKLVLSIQAFLEINSWDAFDPHMEIPESRPERVKKGKR